MDSKLVCLAGEIKVFIATVFLTLFHHCVLSFHYTPKMQVKYKITSSKILVSSWLRNIPRAWGGEPQYSHDSIFRRDREPLEVLKRRKD